MYKRQLWMPVASVSFILLLTLGLLLNLGPHRTASGEISSNADFMGVESLNQAFIEVAKIAKPSVVNISTTSVVERRPSEESQQDPFRDSPFRDFFRDDFRRFSEKPQKQTRRSLGSGVIVREDGYILTNHHVVSDADDIKVTLGDKREFDAKLIGTDKDTELAVIKIDADGLPAATLGDSGRLQVGEWVLAIGNPFRLNHTVTAGIVSAVGRSNILGMGITYQDFIQTDASINPGNSGGPLVNIKGEVVGINTAIALATTTVGMPVRGNVGVGFAVPINMALDVMAQLIENGKVVRGWLGIQFQEVTPDIAEKYGLDKPRGALVVLVSGPAEEAGLKLGDLVVEFNGEPVEDGEHLKRLVAVARPDDEVRIKVIRGGKEKEFKVRLAERTDEILAKIEGGRATPGIKQEKEWMGMTVQELTDEFAQRLGYENEKGVLISSINPKGPAAKIDDPPKGGDLIQEIEFQEIENIGDYRKAIKKVDEEKGVMIRLQRQGRSPWYVLIKK